MEQGSYNYHYSKC